jgi:signal transduction histidine kinase
MVPVQFRANNRRIWGVTFSDFANCALLAGLLVISARLSFLLAIAHGNVCPVWPATGIAIAMVWIHGYKLWPGMVFGVALFTLTTGASWIVVVCSTVASTLEPLIACWLIRRYIGEGYPLNTPRGVFKYVLFVGLIATGLTAILGVAGICLSDPSLWSRFFYLHFTWWLGDVMGAVIVAPALITWARLRNESKTPFSAPRAIFVLSTLVLVDLLVLGIDIDFYGIRYCLAFFCIPVLVWASFQFEQSGAVTASVLTCVITLIFTLNGRGPFVQESMNTSLLLLQCFLGVTSMTALVLGAAVNSQRITEASLARKADELARSNADLEQFAYVASHDLQEPLRMIGSYCQLLERKYQQMLDVDAKIYIHYAVDGAHRMQALIDDLLEYSRVGRKPEPFRTVDCEVILHKATVNLRSLVRKKNAEVTAGDLPRIFADPNQITQLFQNLISNGIKYCQTKPPRVHISSELIGHNWHFRVLDNGIGIAPEHRDRIFLIFQRLHTREEYSGTGIGLAICKRIVDNHGGKIWVESNARSAGSEFYFSIPVNHRKPPDPSPTLSPEPKKVSARSFSFFWSKSVQ